MAEVVAREKCVCLCVLSTFRSVLRYSLRPCVVRRGGATRRAPTCSGI